MLVMMVDALGKSLAEGMLDWKGNASESAQCRAMVQVGIG